MTLTKDTILLSASKELIGRRVVRTFFYSENHGVITGLEASTHRIVGPMVWVTVLFEANEDHPEHEEKIQLQTIQQCKPGSHGIFLL